MGRNKAELPVNGQSLLNATIAALCQYDDVFLSVDQAHHYDYTGLPCIEDIYGDCGPMSGLYSALSQCQQDALIAVSCDMPHITPQLFTLLESYLTPEVNAVIPRSGDGRVHPLCAIYRKSAAPIFEDFLRRGNYRLRDALAVMSVCYVPADALHIQEQLANINTPQDYQRCCQVEPSPE